MNNILLISGSPRANSNSKRVIAYLKQQLEASGADCHVFDLREDLLPLYLNEGSQYEDVNVSKLVQLVEQADGYMVCTPEYHGAMSGALKNALDFLNSKNFNGKPCGIAATAGGGKGGINALNNLRTVMRSLYVNVVPMQVIADPHIFNDEGQIIDERVKTNLSLLSDSLLDSVKRLKS
ncbi:NAD(P)H-dependent oxidoreductase [Paenibacillus sp. ACRRX]|uniref:NADPH-dependent FMN reductase n=1 Tax=unclassified Paenibacillus TaxID=185978 RepID=UPI001EF3FD5E|nr:MULTISPECIES: NAD(P)H-dependent oxidoreductase [unclassified Paenibacillus]MCG7408815.1 NAD(P)H-dependent oxidoreductase [Paenibacillus sp. ACRRX]MDK8183585.1 NAD(P)H-dependent oxidoreductase [Paenibacillus sp. UMB4589-SE434]